MARVARNGAALERGDENRIRIPAARQLSSVLRVAGDVGAGFAAQNIVRADLCERAAGDRVPVGSHGTESTCAHI
jgi:hypothetical protein